jgi:AbrB family looped-hinge helix DNA binding protein
MTKSRTTVKYLTTTKIGEKGQLTIPIEFRDDLGLETGAPLAVLRLGNGLILFPENRRFEELCQRVGAAFGAADVTENELLSGLPDARERVYAMRYGRTKSSPKRQTMQRVRKAK